MPFERKFNADKMLLNKFCLKSLRYLVIASDLQMSSYQKNIFSKKKIEVVEGFF